MVFDFLRITIDEDGQAAKITSSNPLIVPFQKGEVSTTYYLRTMMLVKMPKLMMRLFPHLLWRVKTDENVLYLTFDDGPTPEVTAFVLAELARYNAKATFFVIGDNVRKYPEILKGVKEAGHAIGNHTFNHLNGWKTPRATYLENAEKGQQAIVDCLGEATKLFRPPYGRIRPKDASTLSKDYKVVMWHIIAGDFVKKYSPERVLSNVIDKSGPGSIVVLHDSLKCETNLRYALPKILAHFAAKGYRFEAL